MQPKIIRAEWWLCGLLQIWTDFLVFIKSVIELLNARWTGKNFLQNAINWRMRARGFINFEKASCESRQGRALRPLLYHFYWIMVYFTSSYYDEFFDAYEVLANLDSDLTLDGTTSFDEFEKHLTEIKKDLAVTNLRSYMPFFSAAAPVFSVNYVDLINWKNNRFILAPAFVVDRELLVPLLLLIKNSEFYKLDYLVDMYAFDNFGGEYFRFVVAYRIRNLETFEEISVITFTPEGCPLPSLQDVYGAVVWAEREAWELVGVYFSGHRGLRRLLSDYNFKGHPLRKDFPMTGYLECFYSYHLNLIEFVKVEFMQEYRVYEFYENWEENPFSAPTGTI